MRNDPFTPPPNPWIQNIWTEDRVELVALPALLWAIGVFRGDRAMLGLALAIWAVGFAIWCLWTMWRVTDRVPADDVWRALATLVYGGAPWLLALPSFVWLPKRYWLPLALPVLLVLGVWSLVAARRRYPPAMPGRRRPLMLWGAAVLCLVWAALFAGLAVVYARRSAPAVAFLPWIAAPMVLLDLVLAVQLGRSALRGFTPGRPLTAESLLADAPPTG